MHDLAYHKFLKLEKSNRWFIGRRRTVFSILERYLERNKNARVMDVGCGFGGMLDNLAGFGHPMGLEIDLESARCCKQRGFEGVCLGSGYSLPLKDNSLDLITLFDTLEHMKDDRKVVRQCAAALKPGGHLMITSPAYQFLYADNDRIAQHQRRYTLSNLKRIVSSSGLDVVKGTYFNVLLFPLILPAVLLLKAKQGLSRMLFKTAGSATNLSYRYPGPLQSALKCIFSFERHLLTRISSPAGHSIVLIAVKPEPGEKR